MNYEWLVRLVFEAIGYNVSPAHWLRTVHCCAGCVRGVHVTHLPSNQKRAILSKLRAEAPDAPAYNTRGSVLHLLLVQDAKVA